MRPRAGLDGELNRLAGATRALLARCGGDAAAPFLLEWPDAASFRETVPSLLPVLAWLGEASRSASPRARELLTTLEALAAKLSWRQSYSAADFGAAFLDCYGWTELIGERGPIASRRLAAGFLLLGPDVTYPLHSHDAEEIYLVLSGTAAWRRGDETWRDQAPGALIHHPSRAPHAMRTQRQPLLSLYAWRGGDLAQKSTIEGANDNAGD